MTAGKIEIPLDDIRDLWGDLSSLSHEFSTAQTGADEAADAVGHPGLASAIRSFSSDWDHRRSDLKGKIDTLEKQAKNIADGFTKLDASLADALDPDKNKK